MAYLSRRSDPTQPPIWRDIEPEVVPQSALIAHNAVVLDPATAVRLPGQGRLRPTVYVADSLVIPTDVAFTPELAQLFRDAGAEVGITLPDLQPDRLGRESRRDSIDALAVRLEPGLLPEGGLPTRAPDAWTLLQEVRSRASGQALDALSAVGLDHLLVGCPHVEGHPVTGMAHVEGHPYGIDEYAYAGSGGRAPVSWVGADPDHHASFTGRRPVVAVLDTGIGKHRWFTSGVRTQLVYDGVAAALTDPATDPERTGDIVGPMDGALDSHSGHGTFIAGLIRQICPEAEILALRVMGSDGIVQESDLIRAMGVIANTVGDCQDGPPPIDIVSLSLGYYHEDQSDLALDSVLLKQIRRLGEAGVAVVACAGNDGTAREMYPGAFYPHAQGVVSQFTHKCVPVLSVGALNPDHSVALFSNGGDWVGAWEIGAAVVSTFPQTFNGGAQPSVAVPSPPDPTGQRSAVRASMDPDNFAEGFGTWSGTSFATPILAAKLAKQVLEADRRAASAKAAGSEDEQDTSPVGRMWGALTSELGLERPAE